MTLNILLVDDQNLSTLGMILREDKGHTVEQTFSGERAVGMVEGNDYDLIFMDNQMGPGLTGLETIKKIREFNRDVPIYLHSADSFKQEQIEKAGATGYIRKTYDSYRDIIKVVDEFDKQED